MTAHSGPRPRTRRKIQASKVRIRKKTRTLSTPRKRRTIKQG